MIFGIVESVAVCMRSFRCRLVDYAFKGVAACGVVVVLQMQYEKMQQVASTVMLTMLSET